MIFTLTDRMYNVLDAYETDDYLIGKYVGSMLETLDLNVLVKSAHAEQWLRGNYIMCQDKAGKKYWFTIYDDEDSLNDDVKSLSCYSGTIDVVGEESNPIKADKDQPFTWYFERIFNDTGIKIGVNEIAHMSRKLEFESENATNAEMLQYVLNGFDNAEAEFVTEFDGSTPTSVTLNIYRRIGEEEPQALLSDEDDSLTDLTRKGTISQLGTCINLKGAEVDEKTITLVGKYYEEKDAAGNILYYSPKDSPRIFSVEAHKNFFVKLPGKANGEFDGYINRRYQSEASTQDALWTEGLAQLKKIDHVIVEYDAVGEIDCNKGDNVQIVSHTMRPPIMLSARVVEFKFNDDDPSRNEYKFSNYVELQSNLDALSAMIAKLKESLVFIEDQTSEYQLAKQGLVAPVEGWQKDKPVVPEGIWLWTKTTYYFNTGDSKTEYTANRGTSVNFVEPEEPENPQTGDTWTKPSTGGEPGKESYWDGEKWVPKPTEDKLTELDKEMLETAEKAKEALEAGEKAKELVEQNEKDVAESLDKANSAVDKANQAAAAVSTVEKDVAEAKSDASNAVSQAVQAKGDASKAVSDAKKALDEFDNLEIGGRNLYKNSTGPFYVNVSATNAFNYYKIYCDMAVGETYTVSADLQITAGNFKNVTVYPYAGGLHAIVAIPPNGRISLTFKKTVATLDSVLIYAGKAGETVNNGLVIKNVKVEKGNKATDWSPAPEDVQIELSRIDGELSAKVSQTTFNTLAGTVSNHATQITANQNAITQKADSSTVNTLTGRVTTAEGKITTMAGQIELKANKTDVDTVKNTVTALDSKLTIEAGKITALNTKTDGHTTQIGKLQSDYSGLSSTVSKVETDLNGLEVGGRNLLTQTATMDGNLSLQSVKDGTLLGNTATKGTFATQYVDVYRQKTTVVPVASQYTVSFYARADRVLNITCYFYTSGTTTWAVTSEGVSKATGSDGGIPVALTTTWKKYWITWTHNGATNPKEVILGRILSAGTAWIVSPMIVEGNKPAPWSPAPEDMATVTQFSSLTQTVNSIQTTVANKAEQSQVTQLAGQITSVVKDFNNLNISSRNLIRNGGGNPQTTEQWSQVGMLLIKHTFYKNGAENLFCLRTSIAAELTVNSNRFNVKRNTTYALKFTGFASANVSSMDVHFLSRTKGSSAAYDRARVLVGARRLSPSKAEDVLVTFTTGETDDEAYIRFDNNGSNNGANSDLYFIDVVLVEGNKASGWSPAPEDMATQSQITQLATDINLRVQKNDVVNQINISTEGVLIAGKKIQITGDTYISNGVIGTAHIKDASITDAKIGSLSADKINAGTLNAANVNVINLNANNITTGTISGPNLSLNLATGEVVFKKGSISNADNTFAMNITTGVIASRGMFESPSVAGTMLPAGFNLMQGKLSFYAGTFGQESVSYGGINTETRSGQYLSNGIWQSGQFSGSRPALALSMDNPDKQVWQSYKRAVLLKTSDYVEPLEAFFSSASFLGYGNINGTAGSQNMVGAGIGVNQISGNEHGGLDQAGGNVSKAWVFGRNGVTLASGYAYDSTINGRRYQVPSLTLGNAVALSGDTYEATRQMASSVVLTAGYEAAIRAHTITLWTGNAGKLNIQSLTTNINYGGDTSTNGGMSFGTKDGSSAVWSKSIYQRTTSSAANMFVSSGGILARTTSARKYKADIKIADPIISNAKKLLEIQPVSWLDKAELARGNVGERYYGFIADDFHATGLTEVVVYGEDGQIESLAYDRISLYHNVILSDHEKDINQLQKEILTLKNKLKELEAA